MNYAVFNGRYGECLPRLKQAAYQQMLGFSKRLSEKYGGGVREA